MKKCNKCDKEYKDEDFSKNSKTCKECMKKYHKEYYHNKRKHQKKTYKNLSSRLKKQGFEYGVVDMEKIKNLKWDMVDFPERPHLKYSLSHKEFLEKYNLSIAEYIYIRKKVKDNDFNISSKEFFVMVF